MRTFSVSREPDDPLALRASIGGTPEMGYYLVFRGDPEKVREMLHEVVAIVDDELAKPEFWQPRGPQG